MRITKIRKWVWSGNTTITNRRQPHGTARKSHSTITRHQEDKLSKTLYAYHIGFLTSSLSPRVLSQISLEALLSLTNHLGQEAVHQTTKSTRKKKTAGKQNRPIFFLQKLTEQHCTRITTRISCVRFKYISLSLNYKKNDFLIFEL